MCTCYNVTSVREVITARIRIRMMTDILIPGDGQTRRPGRPQKKKTSRRRKNVGGSSEVATSSKITYPTNDKCLIVQDFEKDVADLSKCFCEVQDEFVAADSSCACQLVMIAAGTSCSCQLAIPPTDGKPGSTNANGRARQDAKDPRAHAKTNARAPCAPRSQNTTITPRRLHDLFAC